MLSWMKASNGGKPAAVEQWFLVLVPPGCHGGGAAGDAVQVPADAAHRVQCLSAVLAAVQLLRDIVACT